MSLSCGTHPASNGLSCQILSIGLMCRCCTVASRGQAGLQNCSGRCGGHRNLGVWHRHLCSRERRKRAVIAVIQAKRSERRAQESLWTSFLWVHLASIPNTLKSLRRRWTLRAAAVRHQSFPKVPKTAWLASTAKAQRLIHTQRARL